MTFRTRRKRKNEGLEYYIKKYCFQEFDLLSSLIEEDECHNQYLCKPNIYLRYKDIRPYIYNNVRIKSAHKFINASWIHMPFPGMFIATQGPLPTTIEDFWTMCDEYDIEAIVMLCKLKEKNVEKCAKYWECNNLINFEIKQIQEQALDEDNGIILRKFQFTNVLKKNLVKTITQIHLTCWEDHTALSEDYFDKIKDLIDFVDKFRNGKPVVVHCSAGVGRTGAFISLYNIYHEIMQQIYCGNNEIIEISVFNLVRKIKELRMFMVENENQYFFLYLFIYFLLVNFN